MADNAKKDIDNILSELKDKPENISRKKSENIDDEVNDILSSLGIEPKATKSRVHKPFVSQPHSEKSEEENRNIQQKPHAENEQSVIIKREENEGLRKKNLGESVQSEAEKTEHKTESTAENAQEQNRKKSVFGEDGEKNSEIKTQSEPGKKSEDKEDIDSWFAAPLAKPKSKYETDTFELPDIKEFAELEQKRAAMRTRKAGEEKLLKIKEQQEKQQLLYAKKQAELQEQKQAELKAMQQEEKAVKTAQRKQNTGEIQKAKLREMQENDKLVKDKNKQMYKKDVSTYIVGKSAPNIKHLQSDPAFLQFFSKTVANDGSSANIDKKAKNTFDEKRTPINKAEHGKENYSARLLGKFEMQDTIGTLPALSQETGTFGAPLSENYILKNEGKTQTNSQSTQKSKSAKGGGASNYAQKQSKTSKAQSAKNFAHEGDKFISTVIHNENPSDTFMQNKLVVNELNNAHSAEDNIEKAKAQKVQAGKNEQAAKNEKGGKNEQSANSIKNSGQFNSSSGSISKEIGIDAPLVQTSTMGIDPDKYGVAPVNYNEKDDYNKLSDAPVIEQKLKKMFLFNTVRSLILAAFSILTISMGFLTNSGAGNLSSGTFTISISSFLIVNLIVLVLACALCHDIIIAGVFGIYKHLSVDTLALFAVFGALLQNIACLLFANEFAQQGITLFAPAAVLVLFFNCVGKILHINAVRGNFEIVSKSYEHSAAFAVKNKQLTSLVCSGLKEHNPSLLVSRPTSLMRGFMRHSFSSTISDVYARKFSIILLLLAVASGAIAILNSVQPLYIISAFCATLCIGAPISCTMVYAGPALKMQRSSKKFGAAIPGSSAIQSLGLCNTVLLRSRDLFPCSNVILHTIKPFDGKRIDLAVLYAASIVYDNCETLKDTFLNIVDNDANALFEVTHAEVEFNLGVTGYLDSKKIIFGNRDMMRRYQIELPSREYERTFTDGGKNRAIYLAVNGELYCVFSLSYEANKTAASALRILTNSGINALIYSNDFNISENLITKTYNISPQMIKILSQSEKEMLTSQTEYIPESDGYMIHKNTVRSFIGGLRAASKAAQREKLANTVEFAGIIFAMVIALILSFAGVLVSLSLYLVLIYQLLWCAITLLPVMLKK